MKNQRMKTEARSFRFSTLAIVVLMIATLICGFTVMASAAGTQIEIDESDLRFEGLTKDATDIYTKEYDGKMEVTVSLTDEAKAELPEGVDVTVTAVFNSKDVKDAKNILISFELSGENASQYQAPRSFAVAAKITPRELDWEGNGAATGTYRIGVSSYSGVKVTSLPDLKTDKVVTGDSVAVKDANSYTVDVNGVTGVGSAEAKLNVTLDNGNYVAKTLDVDVTIEKIKIQTIEWANGYEFAWGDEGIWTIKVQGYDANDKAYDLLINYPAGYGEVNADGHTIEAVLPDAENMEFALNNTANKQAKVVITKKQYTVSMEDVSHIGNDGVQKDPTEFSIAVLGDLPADVRALIEYTLADGTAFTGESAYGAYEITATLPVSDNYEFVDENGDPVADGKLTATMYVNKQYIHAGSDGNKEGYEIILIGEKGFTGDVTLNVSIPEKLARKAISGFRIHKEYTVSVTGAGDATFTVLIPISDSLYHNRCELLTVNDLYVYEAANGTMDQANKVSGYTVSIEDGHYRVEGVSGSSSVTFVIAPEYNAPFWLTAPGIALLILLILALIALMFLIGMYLRRIRNTDENAVLVIDEGEVPAVEPVELEDNVDADAFLAENADEIAEGIDAEAETEATEAEGVEEAVAESMQELVDEASAIEIEEETEEETDVAAEMADAKAEELQDTAAAEDAEAEADEDALRDAVAAAMADNFNESADASDAVVIVAEEEESDEITPEDFKAVVDAIVSDAMTRTMDLPEAAEEATEEAAENAEEVAEEATAEVTEDVAEEVVGDTVEKTEEAVEEAAEEATEEAAEEVTEETTEETAEELVVEEMSGEDICAIVADSVAEAFELITVDGVTPKAVEGTTVETITDAVKDAADANVPETWTEEMAEAVTAAVIDELAARLLVEEEPAVEAFAEVEVAEVEEEKPASDEDDDDNDNDENDEDDGDSFGGFGSLPLDFIDAIAEADKYAEMLEQERNGEVQLVTRYRRSFQSRLIQSQGNVQDYYSILKNALLAHKGVKNRISWNYEAFNRGRTHVAKMNAKTKTLYLYLALDPEELKDTKYGIVDVSSKKKYASVPVLMKIKGDRKFKYALELIAKLCEEKLELPKMDVEEVDYRVPYQTTEELVQSGVVKKLVASVPVTVYGAESTEEAPVVTTPSAAAEAQDVTFIEPTTVPAVEAAAEEVSAEEATETPVEEVPADAPASEDEPKEV